MNPPDPYRIFFPLGIILGTAGVAIWPLYHYGVVASYSGRAHAFVQTDGFLYAFIAGFLLTAVPRFTGTEPPARRIQWMLAATIALSALASEFRVFAMGDVMFLVAHLVVITLAARRFVRRRQEPPATFSLVGLGLMAGAGGAVLSAGVSLDLIDPSWYLLGKRLLTEGMVLLLVLGVGGFLGPRLLGFAAPPNVAVGPPAGPASEKVLFYVAAGLTVLVSVIAEYGFALESMAWLRAVAASCVILSTIRPWRFPAARTTLAWCVWTAHWLVLISLWLVALAPRYRIDFLHVMFIGGFTLLILAVGTRVALSHGGHDLAQERKSWPLRIGLVTGLIAMLARVGAPFSSLTYFEHLAWAALLWMTGILLWGFYLLRLIRTGSPPSA